MTLKNILFFLVTICTFQGLQAKPWFKETLYTKYAQSFEIDKVLYEKKTEFQNLSIFENEAFGKVLTLDGVIQLTERDEFIYHEMLTHVPIFSHGNIKTVLVIGGGDGGIVREVLKHKTIEKVVLVDIDRYVIELSKQYLPKISDGAFDDPRLEVVIGDGSEYVKTQEKAFDLIICDSTDPIGPALVLFTTEFYQNCHDALKKVAFL